MREASESHWEEQPSKSTVRATETSARKAKSGTLCMQTRHVKEVPLDASLLKGGPKNYGTHRVRRKGLPTHVPPSWLVPNPSDGSLDQHIMEEQV